MILPWIPAFLLIIGTAPTVEDLEKSFAQLKDAEAKQDAQSVKRFAVESCGLARTIASAVTPEQENGKQILEYARDVELHTEYALFNASLRAPAATAVDLLSTLEKQNPKSKYLQDAYGRYFVVLSQSGGAAKIPAIAEAALANFPSDDDLLFVLANAALNRKQTDKALNYSERLITVLTRHAPPAGMTESEWQGKKSQALCRARWIAGLMHSEKQQYYEADKDLRVALTAMKADDAMRPYALFHLGVANYQLASAMRSKAQMLEAARFSEQAAAIKGPLSYEAWRNAQLMRTEAAKLR